MAPRLSGQTSIFGVVFFVSKSLLGIERQKKLKKITVLTQKPRSHVRILEYIPKGAYLQCSTASSNESFRSFLSHRTRAPAIKGLH